MNYLFYNKNFPAHYSIGAVVLNGENKVMCHHFKKIGPFSDLYILMRETPESNESPEQTLKRGLMEEFGAEAEIVHYLGSILSNHPDDNISDIEKTTLYFLCNLNNLNQAKRSKNDPESGSEILFLEIDDLIEKNQSQRDRYPERTDLDESKILNQLKDNLFEKNLA